MRKPIIAANWKMNKTRDDALAYIYEVTDKVANKNKVETIIFAPAIYLRTLIKRQEENIRIGAQNMHYEDSGAFTGELSALMLTNIGTTWVLIGHSERRQYFNETCQTVNLKIKQALKSNLKPMLCIGESLEIREKDETKKFLANQIKEAFRDITKDQAKDVVVAYEPIWAIGTGRTATPYLANQTIKEIREEIAKLYDKNTANKIRILYGGSVKLNNIEELLKQSDIDGALIGGASLDSENLIKFTKIASKIKKK